MVVSSAAAAVVDADKIRERAVSSRDVRIAAKAKPKPRTQARKPAGDKAVRRVARAESRLPSKFLSGNMPGKRDAYRAYGRKWLQAR